MHALAPKTESPRVKLASWAYPCRQGLTSLCLELCSLGSLQSSRDKMATSILGPILPTHLPPHTSSPSPDPFWPCPLLNQSPGVGTLSSKPGSQEQKVISPKESEGPVARWREQRLCEQTQKGMPSRPLSSFPALPRPCCVTSDKSHPLLILYFLLWKMEVIP